MHTHHVSFGASLVRVALKVALTSMPSCTDTRYYWVFVVWMLVYVVKQTLAHISGDGSMLKCYAGIYPIHVYRMMMPGFRARAAAARRSYVPAGERVCVRSEVVKAAEFTRDHSWHSRDLHRRRHVQQRKNNGEGTTHLMRETSGV